MYKMNRLMRLPGGNMFEKALRFIYDMGLMCVLLVSARNLLGSTYVGYYFVRFEKSTFGRLRQVRRIRRKQMARAIKGARLGDVTRYVCGVVRFAGRVNASPLISRTFFSSAERDFDQRSFDFFLIMHTIIHFERSAIRRPINISIQAYKSLATRVHGECVYIAVCELRLWNCYPGVGFKRLMCIELCETVQMLSATRSATTFRIRFAASVPFYPCHIFCTAFKCYDVNRTGFCIIFWVIVRILMELLCSVDVVSSAANNHYIIKRIILISNARVIWRSKLKWKSKMQFGSSQIGNHIYSE